MKFPGFVIVFLLALCTIPAVAQQAPATVDAARADFAAKDYQSCLAKVSQILNDRSVTDAAVRYDLLMLRGECMLRLRYADMARDAYALAASAAHRENDVPKYAGAQAMVCLIKASPKLTYTSPADGKTYDIAVPENRAPAMTALLSDRLKVLQPQVKAAMAGTSLTPMQQLVPAIIDLYMVELTTTGDTAQTGELLRTVGARARDLIRPVLKDMGWRFQQLYQLACEPSYNVGGGAYSYRGLTSPERDELKGMCDTLQKIQTLCEDARQLSDKLGGNAAAWDALLADCAEQSRLAQSAYDRRF